MGARNIASANPILTNFAAGLLPELSSPLADFIAPRVTVTGAMGHYKKYDDKNPFQAVATARAVGGTARRVEFSASDPTYNCTPQALEITIDDAERAAAGEADPLLLEQAKTRTLLTTALLSHEYDVFAYIAATLGATGGVGNFSNPDIDPVAQIDSVIQAIATATGRMPNRAIFGLSAWAAFRNHKKVQARQPGAALIGLHTGQASAMLLNPGLEIRVGVWTCDATKFPKTKSTSTLVGSEIYLFHASSTPDLYDPSFAKTFMGPQGGIEAVRTYRDESSRSDVIALDWARDIQVVCSASGARITVS
jgi:hypothetical protein